MTERRIPLTFALEELLRATGPLAAGHPEVEQLAAYHAGELAPDEEERIQDHLSVCRDCGDLVLELEALRDEPLPEDCDGETAADRDRIDGRQGAASDLRRAASAPSPLAWPAAARSDRARARDSSHHGYGDRRGRLPWSRRTAKAGSWERRPAAAAAVALPAGATGSWARRSAAAAALAAAALLVVLWPTGSAGPLPTYTAALAGGVKVMRGEPEHPADGSQPEVLASGNRFELTLRPETAVEGPLEVATFLALDGGVIPWRVPVEISEQGVVRIAGTVGTKIKLPAGESTLLIAIAQPGDLPTPDVLAERLRGRRVAREPHWTAWSQRVALTDAP